MIHRLPDVTKLAHSIDWAVLNSQIMMGIAGLVFLYLEAKPYLPVLLSKFKRRTLK